jgi:hypothetical protein
MPNQDLSLPAPLCHDLQQEHEGIGIAFAAGPRVTVMRASEGLLKIPNIMEPGRTPSRQRCTSMPGSHHRRFVTDIPLLRSAVPLSTTRTRCVSAVQSFSTRPGAAEAQVCRTRDDPPGRRSEAACCHAPPSVAVGPGVSLRPPSRTCAMTHKIRRTGPRSGGSGTP